MRLLYRDYYEVLQRQSGLFEDSRDVGCGDALRVGVVVVADAGVGVDLLEDLLEHLGEQEVRVQESCRPGGCRTWWRRGG